MRKLILSMAAALSALLLFASCVQPPAVESRRTSDPPGPTATLEPAPTREPAPATTAPVTVGTAPYLSAERSSGYGELTEEQKLLYDAMYDVLEDIIANGYEPKKTYPLGWDITYEASYRAINQFCADHIVLQDIFINYGTGDYTGQTFDEIRLTDFDGNVCREQYLEFEAAAEEILSGLTCDGTEYGKALAIAEWLVENVSYAYDYVDRPGDWWLSSAYGPLIEGEAICAGYAQAYSLLCKKAGLDVLYLEGLSGGSEHAWNMVCVGENWYHVDTTWMGPGENALTYFMMSDEMCRRRGHRDWWVPNMMRGAGALEPPIADSDDLYEYRHIFETAEQALEYFETADIAANGKVYWLVFGSYEEQQNFYRLAGTVLTNRDGSYYMELGAVEDNWVNAVFWDEDDLEGPEPWVPEHTQE